MNSSLSFGHLWLCRSFHICANLQYLCHLSVDFVRAFFHLPFSAFFRFLDIKRQLQFRAASSFFPSFLFFLSPPRGSLFRPSCKFKISLLNVLRFEAEIIATSQCEPHKIFQVLTTQTAVEKEETLIVSGLSRCVFEINCDYRPVSSCYFCQSLTRPRDNLASKFDYNSDLTILVDEGRGFFSKTAGEDAEESCHFLIDQPRLECFDALEL